MVGLNKQCREPGQLVGGHWVCSELAWGRMCRPACQQGFVMIKKSSSPIYICASSTGLWTPSSEFPACTRKYSGPFWGRFAIDACLGGGRRLALEASLELVSELVWACSRDTFWGLVWACSRYILGIGVGWAGLGKANNPGL